MLRFRMLAMPYDYGKMEIDSKKSKQTCMAVKKQMKENGIKTSNCSVQLSGGCRSYVFEGVLKNDKDLAEVYRLAKEFEIDSVKFEGNFYEDR